VIAGARTYLVECYSPAVDGDAVEAAGRRATAATVTLRTQGRPVHYVGALLVPADEVVFHLFTATSLDAVREASLRAGIELERVLESIPVGIEALAAGGGDIQQWERR
jgi:hypothetical protein